MKYKIIKSNKIEETLNEMAKEGYEFVCFTPLASSGLLGKIEMIFKKK